MDEKPIDEPMTQNDLIVENENGKEGIATAVSILSRKETTLGNKI